MPKFNIIIKAFGDQALLIEWPNRIDEEILDDIIQFTQTINYAEHKILTNYTPGYNSLLLQYDSSLVFSDKRDQLLNLYKNQSSKVNYQPHSWHIPVCYDSEFGKDIDTYENKGLNQTEVIQLHTSATYRVFMIGFLPGFLYLGGLPPQLHMDRKQSPEMNIPKGSVAIGGEQTGIYPVDSPGGWHIIGRTPLTLFDLTKKTPTPIQQGDNIHFYEVDYETYQNLSSH